MLQLLHLIFVLAYPFVPCIMSEPHYQRLASPAQGITSMSTAAAAAATYNDPTDWQPMQNNWIILHTSPTKSHYPYSSLNHSENYQQKKYVPAKKLNVVKPFMLAISKVPDSSYLTTRRKYSTPLSSGSYKFHRNIFDVTPEKTEKMPTTPDIDKDIEKNMLHISKPATATVTSVNLDTSDFTHAATEASDEDNVEENLSDFLVPLENAIDKVRHFCDLVKNVIIDTDDDDVSYDEVQGRANTASSRQRTSSLAGTGRKSKKLKKKFKKFLLPLLLAYKLKFLTLIPVLIGGLTLLVGSTGLAGFFFALFTAVMSLKSSAGAKTVVVKKI